MTDTRIVIRSPGEPAREMNLSGDATIGRAFDNSICIDDSGVSRYHAVIDERDGDFWLCDLGSRNGTTVNGDPVSSERRLEDGDLISVGGVGTIEFHCDGADQQTQEPAAQSSSGSATPAATLPSPPSIPSSAGPSKKLVGAGIAGGLVVVVVAALLLAGIFGSRSAPTARIVSPQTGVTIRGPETIRVDATEPKKIERIIYLLDGVEFASAMFPPYDARLDPAEVDSILRRTGSANHILTATIEDEDGNKSPQPDTIVLSFDTGGAGSADGLAMNEGGSADAGPALSNEVDVAALCRNLAAQISGKSWYAFDGEFAEEVRRRTGEYRVNFVEDGRRYRREIGNAFSAKGLPLPLGFVTAASQSKFKESASGAVELGFWRVPRRIAVEQGYVAADEATAALGDPKRSAEIAAAYMKELINVFGMDEFMFAIACYGMPIREAAQVRTRIEENDPGGSVRRSFWRLAKSGVVSREGADRVARFFAAGIVGENPRLFGLSGEPLSSLY
ncbi:MAG TPA: FHA domain-containing protein [Blastocatellia bacterium]|nr:FHA domain-containing protein [Blastocatellia bacterium]